MNEKKSLLILGSTGSVGEQAVDVAVKEGIAVKAICANRSWKRVEEQVRLLKCPAVAMSDFDAAAELKIRLADTDTRVFSGDEGIEEMIYESNGDFALNSVLGEAGLMPTIASIKSGKKLALDNKESLVVAGDI
ncbi:MAG: 1-deoxy-D-xylulose-5-phosphate reductoisomerase, partial [Clostridia bacterium]|nr:1-deoxy-D-xylulose-5-phosphate reductoisomerase [Clostridia bacterium]